MTNVLMWQIHRTDPNFPKKSKPYLMRYKSPKAARKVVKEWNQYDNPYDRIGIIKIYKKGAKVPEKYRKDYHSRVKKYWK